MFNHIDTLIAKFAEIMWGPPLLMLLIGGGLFFTIYCRLTPFKYTATQPTVYEMFTAGLVAEVISVSPPEASK